MPLYPRVCVERLLHSGTLARIGIVIKAIHQVLHIAPSLHTLYPHTHLHNPLIPLGAADSASAASLAFSPCAASDVASDASDVCWFLLGAEWGGGPAVT